MGFSISLSHSSRTRSDRRILQPLSDPFQRSVVLLSVPVKTRPIKIFCLIFLSVAALAFSLMPGAASSNTSQPDGLKRIFATRGRLAARATKAYRIPALDPEKVYSLSVSLPAPSVLGAKDRVSVTLRDTKKTIVAKVLHVGDPDLYTLFRPTSSVSHLEVSSNSLSSIEHTVTLLEWPAATSAGSALEAEPNDSWGEANEIALGQTVWATTDDKPYIVALGQEAGSSGVVPYQQIASRAGSSGGDRLPAGGVDWFKFTNEGDQPKLVYFELDLLEQDNIPVDISIYRIEQGEAKVYERGADPVSPPHEVQALPGNKFTTRVVSRGTFYVRVDANHPFYQLKTSVYDVPPCTDPQRAVRAGADYLLSAGESWHANTPRHGGIVNRVSSVHAETTTCIACHATHFTTRAALVARQNGYPIFKRPQLQFLTERLYNNPRPFYGHPDASWARVISAAANVSSRLAALLNAYETEVSGERRTELLKGVGGYLKLYYKGRSMLPKDESNGNTPLVSTYEVAFYSWKVFDELYIQTGDQEYRAYRDQVRTLLEEVQHKNLVDLCYQTIALATIDRAMYADRIRLNAERLLSLQRADGQWSMLFEPESPSVEFQTGHTLYALALAGYGRDHPRIAAGLKVLLARQQEFGGWFDPRQSYENFRTPFRETQFAVMALSEFYKGPVSARGWNAGFALQPERLSRLDPLSQLEEMDKVWEKPGRQMITDLVAALASEEGMVRVLAAAALGRTGGAEALLPLRRALGDSNKMVQLAAAQAIRRITVRDRSGFEEISRALKSHNGRTRWGATRVFSQHFAALAGRRDLAEQMIALTNDPLITVRMQSVKALAQWFYWTKDSTLKDRIADTFVACMAVREHPWMRRNLLEGFYSLADENVRYLYDNWIALIAEPEDRARAVEGHRDASRSMAERIAHALTAGNELQREGLLRALTEFHLRSGGYSNAGRYTRIGNDVETVRFYAEGAAALERALVPALRSPRPERRQRAILAAYTLRDNTLLDLPLLVMQRLIDSDPTVRAVAEEVYRELPLKIESRNRLQAVAALRTLLASNRDEARIAALDRIKVLGSEFATREGFDGEVREFVLRADGKVGPAALRALADFPALARDPSVQDRIASALGSTDQELLRAGLRLLLLRSELQTLPTVAASLDTLLKTTDPARRRLILDLISADARVEGDLRLLDLVVESLGDREERVRLAALGVVRRVKSLPANPGVRAALATLMKDPNQRLQSQAMALYRGQDGANISVDGNDASRPLDFRYFVARIIPILERKGADGNSCIDCHATHTIFRLNSPAAAGRSRDVLLGENYRSALRVVDFSTPENSLILRKPTSDPAQEGVVGAKKLSHGGGQRWSGVEDAAYRTLFEWINGARLEEERPRTPRSP